MIVVFMDRTGKIKEVFVDGGGNVEKCSKQKWEELNQTAEKIEKIVRTISGWATVIFFFLFWVKLERQIVVRRGKKFFHQPLFIAD